MIDLQEIAARIERWCVLSSTARGDLIRQLQSLTRTESDDVSLLLGNFTGLLRARNQQHEEVPAVAELTHAIVESILAGKRLGRGTAPVGILRPADIECLRQAYKMLASQSRAKGYLLQLLATDASASALHVLADFMADDPPDDFRSTALGISPLVQRGHFDASALFPRLLDALAHPQSAALVLDLANFVARHRLMDRHPATPRVQQLTSLVGRITGRLGQVEDDPSKMQVDQAELRRIVDEGVALAVSLCDALALIGDRTAAPKLHQVMALAHRRLQTEAAAALARLGEKAGFEHLVLLAADPASRSRALAYLEELGAIEQARPEDRAPSARAAGRLCDWLAEPSQFGAPPHEVELIDSRRQYWPGYDELMECRLFRYSYRLRDGTLSGIGIVGPVTYSLAADLQDLPPADIYAAFAGWQAEHEELRETPAAELPEWKRKKYEARLSPLHEDGYRDITLVNVGHFFSDEILIASAKRGESPGTLVVDDQHVEWYPATTARRPIGPTEAYYIHKGRKLLASFNPEGHQPLDEGS